MTKWGENQTLTLRETIRISMLSCATILGASIAHAAVQVDESCWTHAERGGSDKRIQFVLKAYTDTDLGKEVGAVVQYAGSKGAIPLVFTNFVRTGMDDDLDAGNYEITRVEVIDGKIGGEYVFAQVGSGIRQGRMVTYKRTKAAKPITFYRSSYGEGGCGFKVN
jgi:hypothetical protein